MNLDQYIRQEGDEPRAIALVERALLGCLIIDCGLRVYARNLKPSDFSNKHRAEVFRAIMDIEGPVDLVILAEHMERHKTPAPAGKYWGEHLAGLLDIVPSTEHVEAYAKLVRQASLTRKLEARRSGGSSF